MKIGHLKIINSDFIKSIENIARENTSQNKIGLIQKLETRNEKIRYKKNFNN